MKNKTTTVEDIMEAMTGSIGPIMKAARKFRKLNQSEVAQAIGCSQSALSKMEHNLLVPSAPQWFLFTRFTSIPAESLVTGVIHRDSTVKFNNDQISLGFKIPRRYRLQRAEKVREIYPFIKFLQKEYPDTFKSFINESEIDIEFFLDFDNLVNFQLMSNLFNHFMTIKRDSAQDIAAIVREYQNDVFWHVSEIDWKRAKSAEDLLTLFADKQLFFQTDFLLTTERVNGKFYVVYRPEMHLRGQEDQDGKITQFMNAYRKYTLENLVERVLGMKVSMEPVQEQAGRLSARFELRF